MKLPRRTFLKFAGAAVAAPAFSKIAAAGTYPSRPITMVVSSAAGGPVDVAARIVAERMGTSLGQSIIIENVGGADGSIGVGRAARARPDGYTLCVGTLGTHVQNAAFYSLPYDVLHGFVPIAPLASIPFVLFARKDIPADDLKDLVAWLKAHAGQASAGMNTLSLRLVATFFQKQTGTQFVIVL